VDVHAKLDELAAMVEAARAMPLSASCVVNRAEVLDIVDEVRALLPGELSDAERLLSERDAVVEEAHAEADRIVADAHAEQARLVSETEVYAAAVAEADRVMAEAAAESDRMSRETDEYVDGRLANLEIALEKTLATVRRGRDRILARRDLVDDGSGPLDDPLPYG
jgi:cell division septum initiation protein DivIVA